jgi:hypothetical protein
VLTAAGAISYFQTMPSKRQQQSQNECSTGETGQQHHYQMQFDTIHKPDPKKLPTSPGKPEHLASRAQGTNTGTAVRTHPAQTNPPGNRSGRKTGAQPGRTRLSPKLVHRNQYKTDLQQAPGGIHWPVHTNPGNTYMVHPVSQAFGELLDTSDTSCRPWTEWSCWLARSFHKPLETRKDNLHGLFQSPLRYLDLNPYKEFRVSWGDKQVVYGGRLVAAADKPTRIFRAPNPRGGASHLALLRVLLRRMWAQYKGESP